MCVGKIKDSFYRNQIEECRKIIEKKGSQFAILEFADEKIPDHLSEKVKQNILEKESKKIKDNLLNTDYVIALCIEGKEMTTKQHQQAVQKAIDSGAERIVYLIGGSLGLDETLKQRANLKLSFSKMTFPHQLMRAVLCEEIAQISGR